MIDLDPAEEYDVALAKRVLALMTMAEAMFLADRREEGLQLVCDAVDAVEGRAPLH